MYVAAVRCHHLTRGCTLLGHKHIWEIEARAGTHITPATFCNSTPKLEQQQKSGRIIILLCRTHHAQPFYRFYRDIAEQTERLFHGRNYLPVKEYTAITR